GLQPFTRPTVFVGDCVSSRRIDGPSQSRLMHDFLLRQLGLVRVPDLSDSRLLFIGERPAFDSLLGVLLAQPLHGKFVGAFRGSIAHTWSFVLGPWSLALSP